MPEPPMVMVPILKPSCFFAGAASSVLDACLRAPVREEMVLVIPALTLLVNPVLKRAHVLNLTSYKL